MTAGRRTREAGLAFGRLDPGPLNLITDVSGVRVGHTTLVSEGPIVRTGVTAIVPHPGDVFRDKVVAAAHVINGFGKAIGLSQVAELGVLETPIVLTNTLALGAAFDGLVSHAIVANPEIGTTTTTVNPVALECNDGWLNEIQQRAVTPDHVIAAIRGASLEFALGSVGAGTGMMLYGWKGGVGSSSRVIAARERSFTVGVLVLANFGRANELLINGVSMATIGSAPPSTDGAGSCIVIVATDAPASSRQLGRLARRAQSGLARTGAVVHHGSGEYVVAFSTAQTVAHAPDAQVLERRELAEGGLLMNALFMAVVEATEEAVIDALFTATEVVGRDGHVGQAFPADVAIALLKRR